jgi:hypothetical protein
MIKKSILAVTIMIIIGFGMIISIPMIFLTIGFSPYYIIEYHKDYYYYNKTLDLPIIKSLNLNTDVGETQIKYTYSPVDYCIKVELNIEVTSQKYLGNSYLDLFKSPNWENTSNSIKYKMGLKPDVLDIWFETSHWIKQEVSLIVTINPNNLFNINTTINQAGDVNIVVPAAINVNNIDVNINQGNIYYEFTYCTIEGNITGSTVFGDITLNANNVGYTKNSIMKIKNDEGLIKFNIIQSRAMNTNTTGIGKTRLGQIKVKYRDYSPEIGAKFTFHNYSGTWPGFYNYWVGFPDPESFYDLPDVGYIFTSFDFPTKNYYNLSLYRDFVSRSFPYLVNLSSVPKT